MGGGWKREREREGGGWYEKGERLIKEGKKVVSKIVSLSCLVVGQEKPWFSITGHLRWRK